MKQNLILVLRDFLEGTKLSITFWFDRDDAKEVLKNYDELIRLREYVKALENEPVRSKSVVRRLRSQTGIDLYPTDGKPSQFYGGLPEDK